MKTALDWQRWHDEQTDLWNTVPGGAELIALLGKCPSFHDGEIVQLTLNRRANSGIEIHIFPDITSSKKDGVQKQNTIPNMVVTLTLGPILHLQLDGFSAQNVIGNLALARGKARLDQENSYSGKVEATDYELEFEPCFGVDGWIHTRSLSISFKIGKPSDYLPPT